MWAFAARAAMPSRTVVGEYGVTCDEPAPNMYWLAAGPMTAIDRTLLRRMGSTPLLRRSTAPPSSARRATARSAALRS